MYSLAAVDGGPPRASLLSIPSEIRLRIYYFLFEDSQVRIHFNPQGEDCDCINFRAVIMDAPPGHMPSTGRNPTHSVKLRTFPSSITRACGTLRNEVGPVLHAATSLNLCAPSVRLQEIQPQKLLASLPEVFLQQTQYVSADWNLLDIVPLDLLNSLKVLKVTGVNCEIKDEPRTEANAMQAIEQDLKSLHQYEDLHRLAEGLAKGYRKYRLLCEGNLFVYDYRRDDDYPGKPCLSIVFDIDSHVVLSKEASEQFVEARCQDCLDWQDLTFFLDG